MITVHTHARTHAYYMIRAQENPVVLNDGRCPDVISHTEATSQQRYNVV